MENWYLVYCKYGQDLKAIQNLERQGVNCLAPRYEAEKVVRGRRKKVLEPMFPRYLFVKFDYQIIHTSTICSTVGVSHFIRYTQMPVIVPDEVIASLMVPKFVENMNNTQSEKGDDVALMKDGIYSGIRAIYKEPDGEARSILLLNILNREVPIVVNNRSFETIK